MKVHQLDVAIPLQLKSQLRKGGSSQSCIGEPDADVSDTMQFVMLTRRGNKQQVGVAAALGARFAPNPKGSESLERRVGPPFSSKGHVLLEALQALIPCCLENGGHLSCCHQMPLVRVLPAARYQMAQRLA